VVDVADEQNRLRALAGKDELTHVQVARNVGGVDLDLVPLLVERLLLALAATESPVALVERIPVRHDIRPRGIAVEMLEQFRTRHTTALR